MKIVLKKITDSINSAPANTEVLNWMFGDQKQRALAGTPVVLYGTGNLGKDMLMTLVNQGISPVCFCNSDQSKSGSKYCDLPVISFEELKNLHRDSLIVVATQTHAASVIKQLMDTGFSRKQVLWPRDFDMAASLFFSFTNQANLAPLRERTSQALLEVLKQDEGKLLSAYNLLADKRSKDLFIAKLSCLICHDNLGLFKDLIMNYSEPVKEFGLIPFPVLGPENYFYFNNDIFSLTDNEVYVDVGAFDGDSVTTFVQACDRNQVAYKHIYAFEPDPKNYLELMKNTGSYKNISCHQLGVWSKSDVMRFESSDRAVAATASGISENGDIEIRMVSLDEFLKGEAVTLLKMDPPGNIMIEALKGAHGTISKYKPKLALGAYHSFEAIYEIPILVNSLWPDYKLYLRHNSWTVCETDLYAVV
jgi:FkbM family methyltransferase